MVVSEAYLQSSEAVSEAAARSRDTWLLIGSGLSAVILFIILIAIFILGYNSHKRKQKSRVQGNLNKSRVFEREAHRGISNIAFQDDQPDAKVLEKFRIVMTILFDFSTPKNLGKT